MIDLKHYKALKKNNDQMNKDIIRLNALVTFLRRDQDQFKIATYKKVESIIKKYDECNQEILKYLIENKFDLKHYNNIIMLMPLKLQKNNEE